MFCFYAGRLLQNRIGKLGKVKCESLLLNDCIVGDILWDKKNDNYYKIILLKGKIREDGYEEWKYRVIDWIHLGIFQWDLFYW